MRAFLVRLGVGRVALRVHRLSLACPATEEWGWAREGVIFSNLVVSNKVLSSLREMVPLAECEEYFGGHRVHAEI